MIKIINERISILEFENGEETNQIEYDLRLLLINELKLVLRQYKDARATRKVKNISKNYNG